MAIKPHPKKSGYYIVSYSKRPPADSEGVRKPVTLRREAKGKAAAQRLYNELVALVNEKLNRATVPSWHEACTSFYKYSLDKGIMPKTVQNYQLCLSSHTYDIWGEMAVNKISALAIRELMNKKRGLSQSHQKNILKFIRAVFNYLVEAQVINSSPVPKMKFKIGDKVKSVLTEKQLSLLLERARAAGSEWYPHWVMASYTGMRNGELYALTWDKVDLESKKIIVDCSWNNKDGFKSTKSGDERIIPIAPFLLEFLKTLKVQSADSIYVLPRIDKWDKGEQARDLRLFLAGLGLPRIRFHDLRASWATILLSKGVEPITVMRMGGWKDMKTMMYYVRMAGVGIEGRTNCLTFHDPNEVTGKLLNLC